MRILAATFIFVCWLALPFTPALAQCQLATDNPPQQQGPPPTDQLDLSLVAGLDPYQAELPQIPPDYLPLMFQRSLEAAQAGDYELAARIYHFMLRVDPKPVMIYNLACVYSLMNKPELATAYIEKAVQFGWTDMARIAEDPDFDNVRQDPAFVAKVAELTQGLATGEELRGSLAFCAAAVQLPYRMHLPVGYDPAGQYDLVLALHGAGDTADNFSRLWTYFDAPGFILAVPQGTYATVPTWGAGGRLWFGQMQGQEDASALAVQTAGNEQYLLNLITQLRAQYPIRNVYLLGFSQGAVMAYATGLHHPELIKGVIAFGGALLPELFTPEAIAAGQAVRVFIAHGLDDNYAEGAQAVYDQLVAAGYDVTLHGFDGGHYINLTALKTAQAWLNGA